MEIHTYDMVSKNAIRIQADLSRSELMQAVGTEVYKLVAQRLADDLYEKHKESFSKLVNPRNLMKRAIAKLEQRVEHGLKTLLKDKL